MSESAKRFIQTATSSLDTNPEAKALAEGEIAALLVENPTEDEALSAAADRMERAATRFSPIRFSFHTLCLALSAGILMMLFSSFVRNFAFNAGMLSSISGGSSSVGTGEPKLERSLLHLSPKEKLLLFGDPAETLLSRKKEALHRLIPNDAAYFADYSSAFVKDHNELPPGFLETAAEIDPGNSWPSVLAAGSVGRKAVKTIKKSDRKPGQSAYQILDAALLDESYQLLQKTSRATRYESYEGRLLSQRISLFPEAKTVSLNLLRSGYAAAQGSPTTETLKIASIFGAKAEQLSNLGDAVAVRDLIRDWKHLISLQLETPESTFLEIMVFRATFAAGIKDLLRAAERLNLEVERKWLSGLDEEAQAWSRNWKEKQAAGFDFDDASIWAKFCIPVVIKQAPHLSLDRERLRPGRMAEHEFTDALFSFGGLSLFSTFAAGCALYRFRGGLLKRLISARLAALFTCRDWVFVLGAGVVLPFLGLHLLFRTTPLAGWDHGLTKSGMVVHFLSLNFMVWAMCVLPMLLGRWRLSRRLPFLGVKWDHAWLGWLGMVVISIGYFSAMSFAEPEKKATTTFRIALIIASLGQIWLLQSVIRGIFGSSRHLLKRVLLSRIVLPAQVLAILLMAIGFLFSRKMETYWVQRDTVTGVSAHKPAMTRIENEAGQSIHTDMQKIWSDSLRNP